MTYNNIFNIISPIFGIIASVTNVDQILHIYIMFEITICYTNYFNQMSINVLYLNKSLY